MLRRKCKNTKYNFQAFAFKYLIFFEKTEFHTFFTVYFKSKNYCYIAKRLSINYLYRKDNVETAKVVVVCFNKNSL